MEVWLVPFQHMAEGKLHKKSANTYGCWSPIILGGCCCNYGDEVHSHLCETGVAQTTQEQVRAIDPIFDLGKPETWQPKYPSNSLKGF